MPYPRLLLRALLRAAPAMIALSLALGAAAARRGDGQDAFARGLAALPDEVGEADLARRSRELAELPGATGDYLDLCRADLLQAEGGAGRPLRGSERRVLARVALALPRDEVLACVRERAEGLDEPGRGAALELLRWHATRADLALLVRLAQGDGGAPLAEDGPLYEAFLAALVELARGDLRAMILAGQLESETSPLRRAIVRAVGAAGDPLALPWLVEQLGVVALAPVALQEIVRLAPSASLAEGQAAARAVRPFLEVPDSGSRRHAMRALGTLRDPEAVPGLVRILESGSSGERRGALAALREISGLGLPGEPTAWRNWHREELRWMAEAAPSALERLSSGHPADVLAALRELSEHNLYRDAIALRLAALLREHEAAVVRRQACAALARLGSRAAADSLLEALRDPDEDVRQLALSALRSTIGLDFGPEPEAWGAAVGVRG